MTERKSTPYEELRLIAEQIEEFKSFKGQSTMVRTVKDRASFVRRYKTEPALVADFFKTVWV